MRIFVMVDMEGISGIVNSDQVIPGQPYYDEGRQYTTWDVNACVAGCFDGGATEVVVRDAHYKGKNFIWSDLDGRAEYIIGGSGASRMPDIASFDGMILLGYHAMAGTPAAVLEHTMSSGSWQNLWIDGRPSGEIGMDMGYAAQHGVPTVMVSGDDKACAEAVALVPDIVTAPVKQAYALFGAKLLSKDSAHALIRQRAAAAVGKCKRIAPIKADGPVTMRLQLVERVPMPSPADQPYLKIIDNRTFEVTGDTFIEAFHRVCRN